MTYTEYMSLNAFQRFWYKFSQFIKAIPSGLKKFFCAIGRGIKNAVVGFFKGCADFIIGFIKGDIITKVSYVVMGFGNMCRGQFVKGFIFFLIECLYILFMIFFGGTYISLFFQLTAVKEQGYYMLMGQKVPKEILVHASYEILLYGILVIMVSLAAVAIYFASVKSARKAEATVKSGHRPLTFGQETKQLVDSRFHTTMLSLPVLLICVFVLLPLFFMILMAFTNFRYDHYDSFNWVGFENFENIFGLGSGGSSMGLAFAKIAGWTIIWAIFATFSNYILGMVVALMINKKGIKLKKLWRTLFVMTIAVPQFVTLLLMAQMLGASEHSPLNQIISLFTGNPSTVDILSPANNAILARITVIIVNVWVGIPYTILMTSGILMNIPEDLYESARIDGAGPVKSFTKITLPYMLFVTTPYLITTFIGNINNFNVIYLLTQGGPTDITYMNGNAGKTDLLITLLFKMSVNQNEYGLGAAIGILVFIVCATISLVTFNMTKSAKNEEAFS